MKNLRFSIFDLRFKKNFSLSLLWLTLLCVGLGQMYVRAEEKDDQKPEEVATKGGVVMVGLPAGSFSMGDKEGSEDEKPHSVELSAFIIDKYEVSQKEYSRLMGDNPARWKGDDNPVEQVRWSDAVRYCNARSAEEGRTPCYDLKTWACDFEADGYRLPTEAEWEYAARAGTADRWHFGDKPANLKLYAWFKTNAGRRARPSGKKLPNPWGLYDMYGNVWEWCHDYYQADYYQNSPPKDPRGPDEGKTRILRGGGWNASQDKCSSTYRYHENPGYTDPCFGYDIYGFRCVRRTPMAPPADAGPNPGTGFIYDPIYKTHDTGPFHPESSERLDAIVNRLKADGLLETLRQIKPRSAETEWLLTTHTAAYVEEVRQACAAGQDILHTPDVCICPASYNAALFAAGGVLAAIDAVMDGTVRNAFCAVRPPGHHALAAEAMGFCLFNNVVIGTRYVQKKYGLAKVLIVDWDVHHGNGTQDALYDDPTTMYFSTHRFPYYPGSGDTDETGSGAGAGTTVNVPMAVGSGDREYIAAFEEQLRPAAMQFKPDFVLISAGFDAYKNDPLGGMKVTADGYASLTGIVKDIAAACCNDRLVSVLEGGYDLDGLGASVAAHIRVMQE